MKISTRVALVVAVAGAAGFTWWWTQGAAPTPGGAGAAGHAAHAAAAAPAPEPKVLFWYDPMKPDVHFDKPGKSPFMDMELLPKYAEGSAAADGAIVEVDPRMAQNLGIRTAPVTRGEIAHSVDAVGAVEVDERLMYAIESRAEGWVEMLAVRAVGDPVKQGQVVAGVYSPDLYSAQEELVLAVKAGDADLIAASRQRVRLLGLSDGQIAQIEKNGKAQRTALIVSPRSGVVTELNLREGQKVMAGGMPLMRIADLSRVWITVEVPEALAGAVSQGRGAQARFTALPGKLFEGRVDYVYPNLDPVTRTLRARVVFENRGGALKPGMFANVAVLGGPGRETLSVPAEAVIRTGKRTVVIVAEGEGRFRPAEVTLGPEHEGRIVILSGIEEGQQVVTSGQFLIDSEASLQGAYQRIEGESAPAPAHVHQHEGAPQ